MTAPAGERRHRGVLVVPQLLGKCQCLRTSKHVSMMGNIPAHLPTRRTSPSLRLLLHRRRPLLNRLHAPIRLRVPMQAISKIMMFRSRQRSAFFPSIHLPSIPVPVYLGPVHGLLVLRKTLRMLDELPSRLEVLLGRFSVKRRRHAGWRERRHPCRCPGRMDFASIACHPYLVITVHSW